MQPHYENIPTFADKDKDRYLLHAIIETPRDIRHKFAFNKEYGAFKLSTTSAEGLSWPYDYGFIPGTLGQDGDPLDLLYLDDEATFSGCLVECRLIGVIRLEKNGEENDRFVACAKRLEGVAQRTDGFNDINDLPQETIESMTRFLVDYSSEEKNTIEFKGVDSRKKALRAIKEGVKLNKKKRK